MFAANFVEIDGVVFSHVYIDDYDKLLFQPQKPKNELLFLHKSQNRFLRLLIFRCTSPIQKLIAKFRK